MKKIDYDNEIDPKIYETLYEFQKRHYVDKKFDPNAAHHFHCTCAMCEYKKPYVYQGVELQAPIKISVGAQSSEKDFVYILKRLQQPNKLVRGIRLVVPEMFCVVQGEIKFLVHTIKDKSENREVNCLKISRQKEKLSLIFLRKFMNEKRQKLRQVGTVDVVSMRTSIVPSSAESLSGSFVQDTVEVKSRDAVLVKYQDNNVQILNESEFLSLTIKRKTDSIWNNIQYVQNYVQPKKANFEILRILFNYDFDSKKQNFIRAKAEISYLNGDISKASEDFIPLDQEEEFERNLKPYQYCEYMAFKVVHFVDIFGSAQVLKATFGFILDKADQWVLVSVENLKHKELNRRTFFDAEIALQKKNKKLQTEDDIEDMKRYGDLLDKQRQYAATTYEDLMLQAGQIKKENDVQDVVMVNILKLVGEDVSNKRLNDDFLQRKSQFFNTPKPVQTLKDLVKQQQEIQAKRAKLLSIRPLTQATSRLHRRAHYFQTPSHKRKTEQISPSKQHLGIQSIMQMTPQPKRRFVRSSASQGDLE